MFFRGTFGYEGAFGCPHQNEFSHGMPGKLVIQLENKWSVERERNEHNETMMMTTMMTTTKMMMFGLHKIISLGLEILAKNQVGIFKHF